MKVHICSFSSEAAELKKSERTEIGVLTALKINPRISTWDMSENPWLCRKITDLEKNKYILPEDEPYPWHRWSITDKGNKYLEELFGEAGIKRAPTEGPLEAEFS